MPEGRDGRPRAGQGFRFSAWPQRVRRLLSGWRILAVAGALVALIPAWSTGYAHGPAGAGENGPLTLAWNGLVDPMQLDLSRIGPSRTMFLPTPPKGMVTVQLLAQAANQSIPGDFQFYLAPPGGQLFDTFSIPRGKIVNLGKLVKNGIAFVKPGVYYTLNVAFRNPTDQGIHFTVVAPVVDPQAALLYARAQCWCAALSYYAPPGGVFYRTIRIGVANNTPPGAKAIVIWPVDRLPGK